jgi:hypothetical protein
MPPLCAGPNKIGLFFGAGLAVALGHVSVETTERYLGFKQRLRHAVNDKIGLEP